MKGTNLLKKVIIWNTGRFYSEKGQCIIATTLGHSVLFWDISRDIDGVVNCGLNEELVMDAYDHNKYRPTNQEEYKIINEWREHKEEILNWF